MLLKMSAKRMNGHFWYQISAYIATNLWINKFICKKIGISNEEIVESQKVDPASDTMILIELDLIPCCKNWMATSDLNDCLK